MPVPLLMGSVLLPDWCLHCAFADHYYCSFHSYCTLQATIYVYQLVDGEVQVEKIDHTKAAAAPAAAAPVTA